MSQYRDDKFAEIQIISVSVMPAISGTLLADLGVSRRAHHKNDFFEETTVHPGGWNEKG